MPGASIARRCATMWFVRVQPGSRGAETDQPLTGVSLRRLWGRTERALTHEIVMEPTCDAMAVEFCRGFIASQAEQHTKRGNEVAEAMLYAGCWRLHLARMTLGTGPHIQTNPCDSIIVNVFPMANSVLLQRSRVQVK